MKMRHAIIIAAVIGALGGIIVALIMTCKTQEIKIELIDLETRQRISGTVFVDAEQTGFPITQDIAATVRLRRGSRFIRAESTEYEPALIPIANLAENRTIELKRIAAASSVTVTQRLPLSFSGWRTWDDEITFSIGENTNEITINGAISDAAGIYNTTLNTALRGRSLILFFSNTRASNFSRDRMVKLEYNRNDILLRPVTASALHDGYLPAEDTPPEMGIEYLVPDDFDGKLTFVFYQAELNDLRITAWYK